VRGLRHLAPHHDPALIPRSSVDTRATSASVSRGDAPRLQLQRASRRCCWKFVLDAAVASHEDGRPPWKVEMFAVIFLLPPPLSPRSHR
jgi:hypothetical protein